MWNSGATLMSVGSGDAGWRCGDWPGCSCAGRYNGDNRLYADVEPQ